MTPPPCFDITGKAVWEQRNGPRRFRFTMRSQIESVTSAAATRWFPPALFTSTSSRPWASTVRSTIASTAARSRTSVGTTSAVWPASRSSDATRSRFSVLRLAKTTRAPWAAKT